MSSNLTTKISEICLNQLKQLLTTTSDLSLKHLLKLFLFLVLVTQQKLYLSTQIIINQTKDTKRKQEVSLLSEKKNILQSGAFKHTEFLTGNEHINTHSNYREQVFAMLFPNRKHKLQGNTDKQGETDWYVSTLKSHSNDFQNQTIIDILFIFWAT